MNEELEGFDTPEEAVRGDIPAEYVRVLGVRIRGDQATVWSVTNDRPPFEWYTDYPFRKHGRWHPGNGSNSFNLYVAIRERPLLGASDERSGAP